MAKLFETFTIGTLEISNRIVRSATAERMADENGFSVGGLTDLWVELARGGTGLIISGHMYIHPSGKCHTEMTGIYSDELIPSLSEAVDAVHKIGGKIAVQINHGGMQCAKEAVNGTIAPSAIREEFLSQPAREISLEEIENLIDAYAQAARRAKEAGFDAVQVHGAHGYLINQFISPFVNKRSDEWGGDLEGRTQFLEKVCHAVREKVGPDYPLFVKFGVEDGLSGGLIADEGIDVISKMMDWGLDAIEISGGVRFDSTKKGIKSEDREAYFRPWAKRAREVTNLPIILVGGLRSQKVMENVLSSGDADFVAMCRPLINDPNFPNQMRNAERAKSDCISSNNCWPKNDGEGISCKCPKIE